MNGDIISRLLVLTIFACLVQGFLPFAGGLLSIGALLCIVVPAFILIRQGLPINKIVCLMLAYVVLMGVPVIWSLTPRLALRPIVNGVLFVLLFSAMYQIANVNVAAAKNILSRSVVLLSAQAVFVYLTVLVPPLRDMRTSGPLGNIVFGSNTLGAVAEGGQYTALSAGKNGGFFINANYAGTLMFCVSVLAVYFYYERKKITYLLIALLNFFALFLLGSKATMVLAVLVPLLAALWFVSTAFRRVVTLASAIPVTVMAILYFVPTDYVSPDIFLSNFASGQLIGGILDAMHDRMKMYELAHELYLINPVLGLGWGGWDVEFEPMARQMGFTAPPPPHNFQLLIWSIGGLPLVGAASAIQILIFSRLEKAFRQAGSDRMLIAAASASWMWVCIQTLGENFGLYGDVRTSGALAALLATALAFSQARRRFSTSY